MEMTWFFYNCNIKVYNCKSKRGFYGEFNTFVRYIPLGMATHFSFDWYTYIHDDSHWIYSKGNIKEWYMCVRP